MVIFKFIVHSITKLFLAYGGVCMQVVMADRRQWRMLDKLANTLDQVFAFKWLVPHLIHARFKALQASFFVRIGR
jgi:hypothetical protein